MEQATLSIRLNKSDKVSFEEFCKSAGLNVSVAVNMFVKAVIKQQRIPFAITGNPFYSEENLQVLRKSIADAEAGKLTRHELIEVD